MFPIRAAAGLAAGRQRELAAADRKIGWPRAAAQPAHRQADDSLPHPPGHRPVADVDALARIAAGIRRIHKADGNPGPGGPATLAPRPPGLSGDGHDGYSGQAEFSMMSTKLARW
jgi:hypothetical protein